MSYKMLRSNLAGHSPHIPRATVRDAVLSLTGISNVRVVTSGLDTNVCRGLYISPRSTTHPLARQFGGHIIVLARGMNRCWQRFVLVKELMHMLDGSEGMTDSGQEFERVLSELAAPPAGARAPQTDAEIQAFWMTLGVLCPEHVRQQLIARRANGGFSDLEIATKLRIPKLYVPRLFSGTFEITMSAVG